MTQEASGHSKAGRWLEAQTSYQSAYARCPDVNLLFNLARVFHKADLLAEATSYYRRYLEAGAEGNQAFRQQTEALLAQILRTLAQRDANRRLVQTLPPADAPNPTQAMLATVDPAKEQSKRTAPLALYRRWWVWTSAGLVTAGVGISIGLGLAARRPDLNGAEVIKLYESEVIRP